MATAKLYCTFVLLLYLPENYAQQGFPNNQNVGINNQIGFQQQAPQRTNTPNSINQMPNGGLNINLPQQSNFQQANLQQPINGNLQGNMQQSLSLPTDLQPQGGSVPLANMQFTKQGFMQLPPGLATNPSKSQTQVNNGARQNVQATQQQNMGQMSKYPLSQIQNLPSSSNSLAEIAALKGYPSLLSLFASQNAGQAQQNQQMAIPNFNPVQNQLTDVQKQNLVRALQSQPSGQNQPGMNFVQTQVRVAGGDNQQAFVFPGQPMSSQQSQSIVTPVNNNQPAYVTLQAQPMIPYMQNQPLQVEEEPSILSLLLSELQPSNSQFIYPPYPIQNKGKSNLKTLIPLIVKLLKEKSDCGCGNCGCPNNACNNNNTPAPTIFSGYSNQKNYGQRTEEPSLETSDVEEVKNKSNAKEQKSEKKNINDDSEEVSEENDSEYVDDSDDD